MANARLENLFNNVKPNALNQHIGVGSLIAFNYMFWAHDPYPLVLVSRVTPQYIKGVNLHYLTFAYTKKLLRPYCDNAGFSYYNVKGDPYIVNAYRSYKSQGIRQVKKLDCDFLLNVLASARSLDPSELDAIKKAMQEQIRRKVNPTAEELVARQEPPVATPVTMPTKPIAPVKPIGTVEQQNIEEV
jgi:hypothetical protein